MKEYTLVWDVAKQNDATVIQIYRRTPEFIGERNQRMFVYNDLIWQTMWEQVPYTEQVERVYTLLEGEQLKNNNHLLLDGTGVGQAVADIARAKTLQPLEIVFSAGAKEQPLYMGGADRRFGGGMEMNVLRGWSVPKVDMIDAAKVMMEQNRIRVAPDIPYEAMFKQQLLHFQGRVNEKGHTTYGNDEIAKHDDFVAAFIMAQWWFRRCEAETKALERPVKKQTEYTWNPFDYTI